MYSRTAWVCENYEESAPTQLITEVRDSSKVVHSEKYVGNYLVKLQKFRRNIRIILNKIEFVWKV